MVISECMFVKPVLKTPVLSVSNTHDFIHPTSLLIQNSKQGLHAPCKRLFYEAILIFAVHLASVSVLLPSPLASASANMGSTTSSTNLACSFFAFASASLAFSEAGSLEHILHVTD